VQSLGPRPKRRSEKGQSASLRREALLRLPAPPARG
jgi:hypothetical protein